MRTFGELEFVAMQHRDGGRFSLRLEPDVMIRAKRMFPRSDAQASGVLHMLDTPEVAADIVWLTQRFPLAMGDGARARLELRHGQYVERVTTVDAILSGGRKLDWPKTPAVEPRDYQLTAADLAATTRGLLIGDEVGLGKTFTSLLLLRDPEACPALVVLPTHLPKQWLRRMNEYMPWLSGHIITRGSPVITKNGATVPYHLPTGTDVIFISYSKLQGWGDHLAGQVRTVIFDEVQELRTGEKTAKYVAAKYVADQAATVVGLSATPVYNYGGETWNIFDVLRPDALGTKSEFAREWGGTVVKDPVALGQHLRTEGLLIRRTRREVGRQLPDPIEEIVEVDSYTGAIDEVVRDAARLADRLLNAPDRTDRFTASGQFDMKMRQATGIDKAPFVADFVDALLESERKVVLYGWHRAVYDIWLERLRWHCPVMYTGSESPAGKDAAVRRFVDDRESRVFICSLRSGAGLDDLQKVANACVFGELDWSPAMHHQAIGRLARDGQDHTVAAFYALSTEGSDPFMRDVLEAKTQQAEGIVAATDADRLFTAIEGKGDRIRQMAEAVLARAGRQDPDDYYGGLLPLEEATS